MLLLTSLTAILKNDSSALIINTILGFEAKEKKTRYCKCDKESLRSLYLLIIQQKEEEEKDKMALEDAKLADVLFYVVPSFLLLLTFLLVAMKYGKVIRRKIFAVVFIRMFNNNIKRLFHPYKKQVFQSLEDIRSSDPELRKEGAIRILEIGVGPGANFEFYPKNSRLVCYDPNPYFRETLFQTSESFPHVHFERMVVSGAENLVDVEDDSIDVVVSTMVLCSVDNKSSVLQEIHRVLTPGGKFYFLEHTICQPGNILRSVQKFLTPLWKLIFDGCRLDLDLREEIRRSKLMEDEMKTIPGPNQGKFFNFVIAEMTMGTAVKPNK